MGVIHPKLTPIKKKNFKSSSLNQVIVNELHLHGNVIVRKEKKTSYAEFVKENSSGRTEENKEPLDTGYNWI